MGRKRVKLSDQVRRAVDECGMTRYRICQRTGMHESVMSRFMTGKGGLSMANLDTLADLLRLDVVARSKSKRSRRKAR